MAAYTDVKPLMMDTMTESISQLLLWVTAASGHAGPVHSVGRSAQQLDICQCQHVSPSPGYGTLPFIPFTESPPHSPSSPGGPPWASSAPKARAGARRPEPARLAPGA